MLSLRRYLNRFDKFTHVNFRGNFVCLRAASTASSSAGVVTDQDPKFDPTKLADCPVNAWNEWDPLEEVIVGRPEGAILPKLTIEVQAHKYGSVHWDVMRQHAGKTYSEDIVRKATLEIEEFCNVLTLEGITVRRPDPIDWSKECSTPDFTSTGNCGAFPRDIWMIVGNEIIEAPMSWYSRYFEYTAYRSLLTEYFKRGASVVAAPKPRMKEDFFDQNYPIRDVEERKQLAAQGKFVLAESEITFEAADFFRAGKDIFARQSHVTNKLGIQWVKQHLAPKGIRVHTLEFEDHNPMHIDTTLYIPKPGVVLSNIKRPCYQIDRFKKAGWKVVHPPSLSSDRVFSDDFLNMNVLMLDENRVVIDEDEVLAIQMFRDLGINCIPVAMRNASYLGGGCHCYTCDIRRRGYLQSYIDF